LSTTRMPSSSRKTPEALSKGFALRFRMGRPGRPPSAELHRANRLSWKLNAVHPPPSNIQGRPLTAAGPIDRSSSKRTGNWGLCISCTRWPARDFRSPFSRVRSSKKKARSWAFPSTRTARRGAHCLPSRDVLRELPRHQVDQSAHLGGGEFRILMEEAFDNGLPAFAGPSPKIRRRIRAVLPENASLDTSRSAPSPPLNMARDVPSERITGDGSELSAHAWLHRPAPRPSPPHRGGESLAHPPATKGNGSSAGTPLSIPTTCEPPHAPAGQPFPRRHGLCTPMRRRRRFARTKTRSGPDRIFPRQKTSRRGRAPRGTARQWLAEPSVRAVLSRGPSSTVFPFPQDARGANAPLVDGAGSVAARATPRHEPSPRLLIQGGFLLHDQNRRSSPSAGRFRCCTITLVQKGRRFRTRWKPRSTE